MNPLTIYYVISVVFTSYAFAWTPYPCHIPTGYKTTYSIDTAYKGDCRACAVNVLKNQIDPQDSTPQVYPDQQKFVIGSRLDSIIMEGE